MAKTASETGGRAIGTERATSESVRAPRKREGIPLARVFGVEIAADRSLVVVFALVTVQLGAIVLPAWHPEWGGALLWSEAVLASLLFFTSITVHEFSHAMVARFHGIPVRRITLFLFGGVAHLDREPRSPTAELTMAAIGPVVSLAIGLGATFAGVVLAGDAIEAFGVDPERAYRLLAPGATLLLWLGPVNVALALFNLVPGFPLDGGRVLRAVLWWWTGDLWRATRWAAGAGGRGPRDDRVRRGADARGRRRIGALARADRLVSTGRGAGSVRGADRDRRAPRRFDPARDARARVDAVPPS